MDKFIPVSDDRPLPECAQEPRAQLTFRDVREWYPLDVQCIITSDGIITNRGDPKILDPVSDLVRPGPHHLADQLADLDG